MSEIEICITCGEELIAWGIFQGNMVMFCPNCDYDDDPWEDPDYCSCRQDEINIFCRWCF